MTVKKKFRKKLIWIWNHCKVFFPDKIECSAVCWPLSTILRGDETKIKNGRNSNQVFRVDKHIDIRHTSYRRSGECNHAGIYMAEGIIKFVPIDSTECWCSWFEPPWLNSSKLIVFQAYVGPCVCIRNSCKFQISVFLCSSPSLPPDRRFLLGYLLSIAHMCKLSVDISFA